MNFDKYILIGGPNQAEIIKALQQFSNNYAASGVTNDLELYKSKSKDKLFIVKFGDQMDLERFKYLINYLTYPEGIDYKIEARGYWTITKNDKIKNDHVNQRVMFYVSPNDTEYDNVFGIFKGGDKTIKFGFAYGEEYKVQDKLELEFKEPELSGEDFELIKTINPDPSVKKKKGMGCLVSFTILIVIAAGTIEAIL